MADDARAVTFTLKVRDLASATLAEIQKKLAALISGSSAGSSSGSSPSGGVEKVIGKAAENAKVLEGNSKAAGKALDNAAESAEKIKGGVERSALSVGKLLAGLHAVNAVVKTIEGTWATVGAVMAAADGDEEKQIKAAARAREAIRSLPVLGTAVNDVGESINKFFSAVYNKAKGQGFTSDQTFAERAAEDAAKVEKSTEKIRRDLELQRAAVLDSKNFMTQLTGEFNSLTKSAPEQQQYQLDQLKKKRDEILQSLNNFNVGGQLTEFINSFTTQTDRQLKLMAERYKTLYLAAQKKGQSELEELQLKGVDRVSDAERVALQQRLDEGYVEAAKQGDKVLSLYEKIETQTLANFDRDLAERRAKFLNELNADIAARGLNATGNPDDARKAASLDLLFKQQQEAQEKLKALRDSGLSDDAQAAEMRDLRAVQSAERTALTREQANAKAEESLGHLTDRQSDLTKEIERTKEAYEDGAISAGEAQERTSAAVQKLRDDTARTSHDIEGMLASGILSPEEAEALKRRLAEVGEAANKSADVARDAAVRIQRETGSAISDFAFSTAKNFKSIGSAAASMFQSISDSLLRMASDNFAKQITSKLSGGESGGGIFGSLGSLFSSGGGGSEGALAALFNGDAVLSFGFSRGGIVPGSGTGDSVPAMLTPQEVVTSVPVVNAFGGPEAFQDFIALALGFRSRRPVPATYANGVQHLAAGGIARAASPFGSHPREKIIVAPIPTDNVHAKRVMDGGKNAVMSFMYQHKTEIRALLNID